MLVSDQGVSLSKAAVRITPEWAKEILSLQDKNGWVNRKLYPGKIKEFKEHMIAGTFAKNTTIQLSPRKRLLDAWHRLNACVEANVPFYAVLLTDVPEADHIHIDVGTKRTIAHKLTFEGIVSPQQAASMVAALNTLNMYLDQAKGRKGVAAGPALSQTQGLNLEGARLLLEQHPGIRQSLEFVGTKSQTMSAAIMTCIHYLMAHVAGKQRDADTFIEAIKSGAYLSSGSPVLALRKLFLEEKPQQMSAFGDRLWITIEAANRFLANRSVRGGQFSKKDLDEVEPSILLGADPQKMRRFTSLIKGDNKSATKARAPSAGDGRRVAA